jgi:hypothetical protein
VEIWHLRRLLGTALSAGVDRDVIRALNALARRRPEIERAIVVWIDLIETLVQSEEQRYGPRPGLGPIKAAEVKNIFRYLLRSQRFALPNVPEYLRPFLVDVVVDWCVDVVVLLANQYGLWELPQPRQHTFRVFIAVLWKWVQALFKPIWLAITWLFSRLWSLLQPRITLSPAALAAVRAVEREGLIVQPGNALTGAVRILAWVGSHRAQVIAMFELVFIAVQEAESYLSLSGPEKKAYARDLVLAVLDELGFRERVGLLFAIISSLIDGTIESAVHVFNKRGIFVHRSSG